MTHDHKLLSEWVTYNEYMCSMIRRNGAPATLEIAKVWLDTIGKWAERSRSAQIDGSVCPPAENRGSTDVH